MAWRWTYGDTEHHKWVVSDIPPPPMADVFRVEPLYAAPAAADGDARDAARWRYFRSVGLNGKKNEELDAAFDAAMSKEQP